MEIVTNKLRLEGFDEPPTEISVECGDFIYRYILDTPDTGSNGLYKNDQRFLDGLLLVMDRWCSVMPDKPHPRKLKTTKAYKKLVTRWGSKDFREGWQEALEKAASNSYLVQAKWFTFEYFVRNDENWRKILDGVFDGFAEEKKESVWAMKERLEKLVEYRKEFIYEWGLDQSDAKERVPKAWAELTRLRIKEEELRRKIAGVA